MVEGVIWIGYDMDVLYSNSGYTGGGGCCCAIRMS